MLKSVKSFVSTGRVGVAAFVGGAFALVAFPAFAVSTSAETAISTALSGFLGQVWSIADIVLPIAVGVWLLVFGWHFARGLIH